MPPSYVLYLPGENYGDHGHVSHGWFWDPQAADLGPCHWEAWCKPLSPTYLISDAAGGAHALLWGVTGDTSAWRMSGNMWLGDTRANAANASFTSFDQNLPCGELVHLAVTFDQLNNCQYTHINGICSSVHLLAAGMKRFSQLWAESGPDAGFLYVGGSDHSMGSYKLSQIAGWEGSTNSWTEEFFLPHWRLGRVRNASDSAYDPPQFLCDYTTPGNIVPDLSPKGYGGSPGLAGVFHPGHVGTRYQSTLPWQDVRWVEDYDFPTPNGLLPTPPSRLPRAPLAPPGGVKIFDSFSRANSGEPWMRPTLLSTEAGSLGPKVWQKLDGNQSGYNWSVFNGAAVPMARSSAVPSPVVVSSDSANGTVQVKRAVTHLRGLFGLVWRGVDAGNYWYVESAGDYNNAQTAWVWRVEGGSPTLAYAPACPATNWETLQVAMNGATWTLYADGNQIAQDTSGTHSQGVKHGLHVGRYAGGTKYSSLQRMFEFAIF